MRALESRVSDAVWAAVKWLLPRPPDRGYPLGCHRPRIADAVCFRGIMIRLVTGASWVDVEAIMGFEVSDTTLRARRDEWIAAGVFDRLCGEALEAFDRVVGLDLSEVALDGSLHKSPCGGERTGKSPVDRGKLGWRWSLAVDRHGVPVGWAIDGANRNDIRLLEPTLAAISDNRLLNDIETLHMDRGYDYPAVRDRLAAWACTMRASNAAEPTPQAPNNPSASDCAGSSNEQTPGCPTTDNYAATQTATPKPASDNSHSPSPRSSPSNSPNRPTNGTPPNHLFALALS